jgi:hypothetical protein
MGKDYHNHQLFQDTQNRHTIDITIKFQFLRITTDKFDMKNLIALVAISTFFTSTTFAQFGGADEKDKEAKKNIVNLSKQEWKDAMKKYETDMDQNRKVMIEIEFLKYKATTFDQSIKNAESRRAKYEATLKDPNEAVRNEAQANLDRLNEEITDLKLQKADSEATASQFEKDVAGTFKTVEQIENELNNTQTAISSRLAPFKADGGQIERLGYIFVQQDLKYNSERRSSIASNADFRARKSLNKKYPPSDMFHSEVTNFYAQRSSTKNTNGNSDSNTNVTIVVNNKASNANTPSTTNATTTTATISTAATATSNSTTNTVVTTVTTNNEPSVTNAQTVQTNSVANTKPCEDEALKEIYKIISSDKNNGFAKMYELTVMKLAKKTLESNNKTLEGYTNSKIAALQAQLNQSKDSVDTQKKVADAYELYGKSGDLTAISTDLDKSKNANYWSKTTRLWNEQTSSYVLAASIADPSSGLKDSDAAIIWAVEKLRLGAGSDFAKNTQKGNLMNTSTRVTRYLGTTKGTNSETVKSLDGKIAALEKELNSLIQSAYATTKVALSACLKAANPNCADCANEQMANFEKDGLGLEKIQRGLASKVAKGDNQKMEGYLKGKLGDVSFDFNKTLAKQTMTAPTPNPNYTGTTPISQDSPLIKALNGEPFTVNESNLVPIPGTSYYVQGNNSNPNNDGKTRKIVKVHANACVAPNRVCTSSPTTCCDNNGRIVYQNSK